MGVPLIQLKPATWLKLVRPLEPQRVQHFLHASECDALPDNRTVDAGRLFEVVEVDLPPSPRWVRVKILGRDPAVVLKLTGSEFAPLFDRFS